MNLLNDSIYSVVICDENPMAAVQLEHLFRKSADKFSLDYRITVIPSPLQLKSEPTPHILFYAPQFVTRELRSFPVADENTRVVMVTEHNRYLNKVFIDSGFYHLYTPFEEQQALGVINRLLQDLLDIKGIRCGEQEVPFASILYFEKSGQGSLIHTTDGRALSSYFSLEEWKSRLDNSFFKGHPTFIPNFAHVTNIHNGRNLELNVNGQRKELRVPFMYRRPLRKAYHEHLMAYSR